MKLNDLAERLGCRLEGDGATEITKLAYDGVGNGNKSQVHWDMVCIQRPEYGGGEIWFDGKLIRKDGQFVPKSLHKLNPEYLLGNKGS